MCGKKESEEFKKLVKIRRIRKNKKLLAKKKKTRRNWQSSKREKKCTKKLKEGRNEN